MSVFNSPLVLSADIFSDMTDGEMAIEIELMFERSKAISQAISGNMPVSELCELVRSQDYDIDEWAEACDLYGDG